MMCPPGFSFIKSNPTSATFCIFAVFLFGVDLATVGCIQSIFAVNQPRVIASCSMSSGVIPTDADCKSCLDSAGTAPLVIGLFSALRWASQSAHTPSDTPGGDSKTASGFFSFDLVCSSCFKSFDCTSPLYRVGVIVV